MEGGLEGDKHLCDEVLILGKLFPALGENESDGLDKHGEGRTEFCSGFNGHSRFRGSE